jgi:hypothetical protein
LKEIVLRVGLGWNSCLKWRKRFQSLGLEGLQDRPGRGRHQVIGQEERLEVMALACTKPVDGSNRWSVRKLAEVTGLGSTTVHRILNAGDLKPHKVSHWCGKSPDPEFEAKQAAIIGLYMNPPENALVLPWTRSRRYRRSTGRSRSCRWPGAPKRMTATYKRHGTTCLLAALALHEGTVEGRCQIERLP